MISIEVASIINHVFCALIGQAKPLTLTKDGAFISGNASISGNADVKGKLKENGNDLVPRGTIVMWSGDTIPGGWIICDGNNGTPDLRNRFVLGATFKTDGTTSFGNNTDNKDQNNYILTKRKIGTSGGEENHKLTPVEIPHRNNFYYATGLASSLPSGIASNISDGNYQPHNNMPPFYVLAFIMKE